MAIKVLVLDDEPEILDSLRRLLELDGRFEVLTTVSPKEALSLVAREKIQIILCDIVMPEMDGLEFLERTHSINGLVQIIMMTAYSSVDRVLSCLEKGAADYLMKPFDVHEVRKVLDQVVQRLERWRELVIEARRREIAPEELDNQDLEGLHPIKAESPEDKLELLEQLIQENPSDLSFRLLNWLEEERDQMIRERLLEELSQRLPREKDERLLRLMLSSPEAFIRNGAIDLAQDIGNQLLPQLANLLEDPDKDIRKLSLDILAHVETPEAEPLLLKALEDKDPNVRMTAAEYIGQRGLEAGIPRLEEMALEEEDLMVQATALEALAGLKKSPRSQELIETLKEERGLRASFLKYLAAFGRQEDLLWLEEALKRGKLPLSREALEALRVLISRHDYQPQDLQDYLLGAIKGLKDPLEVYLTLQVLELCDPQEAQKTARELVKGPLGAATGAINFLAEYGSREDRDYLEGLKEAKGEIGQTIKEILEV
ncbi:response regulator [Thermosulfuriphilus sp.]